MFRLILCQGLKLVFVGLLFGIASALTATRVMRSLLFGITPNDPFTLVIVSVLLILITLLASGIPARRAAEVDPWLRYETNKQFVTSTKKHNFSVEFSQTEPR